MSELVEDGSDKSQRAMVCASATLLVGWDLGRARGGPFPKGAGAASEVNAGSEVNIGTDQCR